MNDDERLLNVNEEDKRMQIHERNRGEGLSANDRLLNVEEVADLLGVSEKTIYNWVYERRIPHVKPTRGTVRFKVSALRQWIESRSVPERTA